MDSFRSCRICEQTRKVNHDEQPVRTIKFSDRVACPRHGQSMVLVTHYLSEHGARLAKIGKVTFFRCTAMESIVAKDGKTYRQQCNFMRPNKYQRRRKGERHK